MAEQDLRLGADMSSPAMTKAEMSRADVEAMIAAANGRPIDLHDEALSGLDLSGLNLRGANLRTARLNTANLRGTDLGGANLEQAWFLKADLSGADLTGSAVAGADFRNVDVSGVRPIDLKGQAEVRNWAERMNADRPVTQASN
ncbi:pentapeptide repeat-containing protein [Methylobacterium sp. J-030]|uniref:pentapeptide repeat-containing protein n=1 Tax=Methylobacterium sp. J-030 TaxID=2836627 RepID=UPI001FB97694|nr:pentapeptide repeat-containing protein [Methylobacterium sp. J-030]MCJ2073530.1 pentapeptide repeat-containing protein [Methylobacterium sp. J-030]